MNRDEKTGRTIREAFERGSSLAIITMVDGKLVITAKQPNRHKNVVKAKTSKALVVDPEPEPRRVARNAYSRVTKRNLILRQLYRTLRELVKAPNMYRALGKTNIQFVPRGTSIRISFPHGRAPMYLTVNDAPNSRLARSRLRRERWMALDRAEEREEVLKHVRQERRRQDPDYQLVIEDARRNLWHGRERT